MYEKNDDIELEQSLDDLTDDEDDETILIEVQITLDEVDELLIFVFDEIHYTID